MKRYGGLFNMDLIGRLLGCVVILLGVLSCQSHAPRLAPVAVLHAVSGHQYQVQRGDSLYSIAWAYGVDGQTLARFNHLKLPYRLKQGDVVKLPALQNVSYRGSVPVIFTDPAVKRVKEPRHQQKVQVRTVSRGADRGQRNTVLPLKRWHWPLRGVVKFAQFPHQGVWIKAHVGAPVRASASGSVVYSGRGLKGYGHLILIKHSHQLLSAYGYNHAVRIKMGQRVAMGQILALVGRSQHRLPMIYFEIRNGGQAIDLHRFFRSYRG
jgi:lipoprotein NlpD